MKILILIVLSFVSSSGCMTAEINSVQSRLKEVSSDVSRSNAPNGFDDLGLISKDTFLVSDWGGVWKTKDSTKTWTKVLEVSQRTHRSTMYFLNENRGFIVIGDALMMTNDGGDSWTQIATMTFRVNTIFFINENEGWIGGDEKVDAPIGSNTGATWKGKIAYTKNGGKDWNEQEVSVTDLRPGRKPINWAIRGIYFTDNLYGWAAGFGVLFQTTNGGRSWKIINKPTLDIRSVYFLSKKIGWLNERRGGGFEFTNDGGNNWYMGITPHMTTQRCSVFFTDDRHGYLLDALGILMQTTDGGKTWNEIEIDKNKRRDELIREYRTGETFIGKGIDGYLMAIWSANVDGNSQIVVLAKSPETTKWGIDS